VKGTEILNFVVSALCRPVDGRMEMHMNTYENAGAISFPLGGIGAGSVGLAGDGRLIDFEWFHRPNRCCINPFSHFAIKTEADGILRDCRVLQGDMQPVYMGNPGTGRELWAYGNGADRGTMAGFVHFADTVFQGPFPIAQIEYKDSAFPGSIQLRAMNPFIPMNDRDSSIPAAFFQFELENNTQECLEYTLAFSCNNLFGPGTQNTYYTEDGVSGVCMTGGRAPSDPLFGNAVIAALDGAVAYQEHWYRGGWFDEVTSFWRDFCEAGPLQNRTYSQPGEGSTDVCTLASRVRLVPGETTQLRFLLTWYVPWTEKYWDKERPRWKTYYTTLFANARQVAVYCSREWDRLWKETALFAKTLFTSSLPEPMLDAIQGTLAVLKSSTCLRLENGEFYGWEGVTEKSGSCEGTCSHVWNYAWALAYLFPSLERSIRETEMRYNLYPDGKMGMRTTLPLGASPWGFRACLDGQMGTVLKMYREWKISGDNTFLCRHWGEIKRIIQYAWNDENPDQWDPERSGVLTGRQHHTLDMELFGPSSWLEGFYLAALRAASEMACAMDDVSAAEEFESIFGKGKKWMEDNLWNGAYYIQKIDLCDKRILDAYEMGELINADGYWNEEAGEIKYQIGDGCAIDQVVAAWHGDLLRLGEIFDPVRRKAALESIYRNNFKSMRSFNNPCRVFCLNDEQGVIMCSWDAAAKKPVIPLTYAQEVMTGFEYALACNMLQCGMEKEAIEIVLAVRHRYDGHKRNPWAELECGASYARSMASYSLLLAYSGFWCDMTKNHIAFRPLHKGRYFWSAEGAWGTAVWEDDRFILKVLWGELQLSSIEVPLDTMARLETGGKVCPFTWNDQTVFADVFLHKNEDLQIIE
jgi:non-lysosomal glucosylceramidase